MAVTFEIVEEIAVLSTDAKGWTTEVNLVSWNGGKAKLDIRKWSPDRERAGKGIGLNYEETELLKGVLEDNEDLDYE